MKIQFIIIFVLCVAMGSCGKEDTPNVKLDENKISDTILKTLTVINSIENDTLIKPFYDKIYTLSTNQEPNLTIRDQAGKIIKRLK